MSFVELCDTLYLPTPKCFPLVEKVSLAIGQNSLKVWMHQANFCFVSVHFFSYKNFKLCKTLEVPSSCQSTKLMFDLTLREDKE